MSIIPRYKEKIPNKKRVYDSIASGYECAAKDIYTFILEFVSFPLYKIRTKKGVHSPYNFFKFFSTNLSFCFLSSHTYAG